ncbi:peptidase T [Salimicrobium halophilum]|uniref:Peptidase T n=1 Tax=Salimicrobium halophilum TaxID=86666 RepID=A0A1G8T415_9BACI|nr:peptidase T [Salimicrobium halophilum]SDJ36154.1 peptidase T. Metallo peptidase. MEROPS family M20B [Salimicrobium halophilum]
MKQELLERFTSYVKIDTQSSEDTGTTPSTEKQWDLANKLVEELEAIGMDDVSVDKNAYVMATLPSNTAKEIPTIGFLAHIDTATDFTGTGVNPQVWEDYDGKDLKLNEAVTLSPNDFPSLLKYTGHTLVTTDGTTLLGADNKAGIAEIMTAMHHLIQNPSIPHGDIRVAFTPDEEIGKGPHHFDVEKFGADLAYTIDGGELGELEYESFNAAGAMIMFQGRNVHPGSAKNSMVHASKMAMAFHDSLPTYEAPEFTEDKEGFYHLIQMEGDVETARLGYIIRDHDKEKFAARKEYINKIAEEFRATYGESAILVKMEDQYYNMGEKIEPVMEIVDAAEQAMKNKGIKPLIRPIRGGTDGSQLSYMGLPTPNIFTGGENYHGKYEYISLDNMEKASETIVEISRLFATEDTFNIAQKKEK